MRIDQRLVNALLVGHQQYVGLGKLVIPSSLHGILVFIPCSLTRTGKMRHFLKNVGKVKISILT